MLDSGQLTGEADFPEVNLDKFGWQQYVSLNETEVEERCWRADIIISTNTPVTAKVSHEAFKLKLMIAAVNSTQHIEHAAAITRGIQVMNIEGLIGNNAQHTKLICTHVVEKINQWLKTIKA